MSLSCDIKGKKIEDNFSLTRNSTYRDFLFFKDLVVMFSSFPEVTVFCG